MAGEARAAARSHWALAVAWTVALGAWSLHASRPVLAELEGVGLVLHGLRIGIELVAALFLVSTVLKALAYLGRRPSEARALEEVEPPPSRALVLYLCCGDLDEEALESLCRLRHEGELDLVVHDDSRQRDDVERVRRVVERLEREHGRPIRLLKREERSGGKPGAVSWVLERLAGESHDVLVLCDNDSVALDRDVLPKALRRLARDPDLAVVQCRSRGLPQREAVSGGDRWLHRAIDVFDVFMEHHAEQGSCFFIGHAAVVRLDALREAGGFRAGTLSDDIDLTVRLALRGRRVDYAPEIEFGERHPPSYAAFRRRATKWAFGCMQVLSMHLRDVLLSRRMRLTQKLGFLEFAGFYALQAVLCGYLLLAFVLIPLIAPEPALPVEAALLSGSFVLAAIYLPAAAWAWRHRRLRDLPAVAWAASLVYGSASFATLRGVADFVLLGRKDWVPTNASGRDGVGVAGVAECLFGLCVLAVPLTWMPSLLWMPSLHVFAANFLLVPLVDGLYRPAPTRATASLPERDSASAATRHATGVAPRSGRALAGLLRRAGLAAFALIVLLSLLGAARAGAAVTVDGERLLVDGEEFLLKGLHYSPWLPGTGPAGDDPWPEAARIEADLDLIEPLGVNALLVHEAPPRVVEAITARGLHVLHAFHLDWQSIHEEEHVARREREIVAHVAELSSGDAEPETAGERGQVILWILGNEVPAWIAESRRDDVVSALTRLHAAVREADPQALATHSTWPPAADLALSEFPVAAFNLYPLWPREVVVRGYGAYIEEVLKPIAAGRPLLLTEFGVSALEVGRVRQAAILRDCWSEIRQRTSGGVVFEFCDEWWKNYDNPIDPSDYWTREHDPDDALTHDLDPEEHYGIVDHARGPKPAYEAVREMFAEKSGSWSRWVRLGPLVVLAVWTVLVLRRRRDE